VRRLSERRAQALAGKLHQTEARDLAHLHARAVVVQRLAKRFSTSRWLRLLSMSMKSMTIKPPRSRSRNWRAISSAASRLVLNAVCSMSVPRVARAEFTSIATSASVWSMTIAPPEGKRHLARVRRLDLMLDLEAREQRDVVAVELHAVDGVPASPPP
jgi:hypothetical protein